MINSGRALVTVLAGLVLGFMAPFLWTGCAAIMFYPTGAQAAPTFVLSDPEVDESSGLAVSLENPGLYYTHNDSGDQSRIFVFDRRGANWGRFTIEGADAIDWEDMSQARIDGRNYLILADVGDNFHSRSVYSLYVVKEPVIKAPLKGEGGLTVWKRIDFHYSDGPENCEAVMFDSREMTFYLAAKNRGCSAPLYALPWPENGRKLLTAIKIADLHMSMITGGDISPDGTRAIIITYGEGGEYVKEPGRTWEEAFLKKPQRVELPSRRQGEAVCYGLDGRTIILTSEGKPAPVWIMEHEAGQSGAEPRQ